MNLVLTSFVGQNADGLSPAGLSVARLSASGLYDAGLYAAGPDAAKTVEWIENPDMDDARNGEVQSFVVVVFVGELMDRFE